jgi:sporulation protein YlmC with PRC-barrel domain
MARHEIHVEHLVGRRVLALNGRAVGRLEEICAEPRGNQFVVTEYHVGIYAAFDRLSGGSMGRTLLSVLPVRGKRGGYRVPWNKLDLSDPLRPRLRCSVDELEPLEA